MMGKLQKPLDKLQEISHEELARRQRTDEKLAKLLDRKHLLENPNSLDDSSKRRGRRHKSGDAGRRLYRARQLESFDAVLKEIKV